MLLVASETGHVYTFATKKLQPMITSEAGKALIKTCLNSPEEGDTDGRFSNILIQKIKNSFCSRLVLSTRTKKYVVII